MNIIYLNKNCVFGNQRVRREFGAAERELEGPNTEARKTE